MKARTLTTLGIPIRTELRLKSLLAVMDAKTFDHWTFIDGTDADVVICEPTSALSTITLKRLNVAPLRCVSLVKDADTPSLPGTLTLRDPVRPGDFLDLLNTLSTSLGGSHTTSEPNSSRQIDGDPFKFGATLRGLLRSTSDDVFMLDTGRFVAHVVPASRAVLLQRPLDVETLHGIAQPDTAVNVVQFPPSHADQLLKTGAQLVNADSVLWRVGLHGPTDRVMNELTDGATFKLRRWPDFGQLEHSADHLRIAARLSRKEIGIAELASAVGQTPHAVTPFINACGLCELLKVVPRTARREPTLMPAPPPRARQLGIFQSIRSVLGFGVSST